MLKQMPEYQRLSSEEKLGILRRMMKVYAAHRHPERPAMIRKVVREIAQELREKKSV